MSARLDFTKFADAGRGWWKDLQPERHGEKAEERVPDAKGTGRRRGDPAALARLRRAATLAEAMSEEATLDLYRRLGLGADAAERRLPRVAVVAHALAHVREDVRAEEGKRPPSAVQAVGRTKSGDADSAIMGPLRLRRLLAAREDVDLMIQMRRLVDLAPKRRLNVGDLAASILFWGDAVRARWAFDYYGAGLATPADDATPTDQEA